MSTELARTENHGSLVEKMQYAERLAMSSLLPRSYQKQPANVLFT
jgi:hypothetical protein